MTGYAHIDYDGVNVKINDKRISTETGNIDDNSNENNTDKTIITTMRRTIFVRRVNHCRGHQ